MIRALAFLHFGVLAALLGILLHEFRTGEASRLLAWSAGAGLCPWLLTALLTNLEDRSGRIIMALASAGLASFGLALLLGLPHLVGAALVGTLVPLALNLALAGMRFPVAKGDPSPGEPSGPGAAPEES